MHVNILNREYLVENLVDIHIISQMLCWVTYIEPKILF